MLSDYDLAYWDDTMQASHFTGHLIRLFQKADLQNRAKLKNAFPDVGAAFEIWFHGQTPTRELIDERLGIRILEKVKERGGRG